MVRFECNLNGTCCYRRIALTGHDIVRLCHMIQDLELDKDIAKYIHVSLCEKSDHFPIIEFDKGKGFPAINKFANGRCIFQKKGLCSIYEYRPSICRIYPFYVEIVDGKNIVRTDYDCNGVGKGALVPYAEIKEMFDEHINEMKDFVDFVNEWNVGNERSFDIFLRKILIDKRFEL